MESRSRLRRALWFLPYLVGVSAIWAVSSMSAPPIPAALLFENSDKWMHAAAYAALGVLAWLGARVAPAAFVMAAAYGVVDELHQSFVPGRSCSAADWLADATGAALGVFLATRVLASLTVFRPR